MRGKRRSGQGWGLEQRIQAIRLVAFDFDGVFTDNRVYVFEDGSEAVRCSRADGLGLRELEHLGVSAVIISTETNPVVSVRSRKLGVRCFQGSVDKRETLQSLVKELGFSLKEVAFVGNDVNDISCMTGVGLPIVVRDAHPRTKPFAFYRTKARGGHGAVREVCELFRSVLRRRGRMKRHQVD